MDPAARALALAWTALLWLPLVVGGLWADLLPGAEAPSLDGALRLQLGLCVWVLPGLLAMRPPGSAADAVGDVALLAALAAPPMALAAAFSALAPDAAARGLVHAGALGVALTLALALAGRRDDPAGPRPRGPTTRVGLVVAWTAALPLAVLVGADLAGAGDPPALAWLSPALGQQAALEGRVGPALVGAVLPPLALLAARPWRHSLLAAGAAALLVALWPAPAVAGPSVEEARAPLRDAARPGQPWPVWLTLDGPPGELELRARSQGTVVVVPAAAGAPALVPAVPAQAGPITLSSGEALLEAELPSPAALGPQKLLVGLLGPRMRSLASSLAGKRAPILVSLEARDARWLPRAGQALDLLVVARGQARDDDVAFALRAWAATGGVAAFDARSDLEAVAGHAAAAGGEDGPWEVRPLGAGLLVGPARGELGLLPRDPASLERLASRLRHRARHAALADAALAAAPPGPSRQVGRAVALAAAGAALGLSLGLLAAARLRRRPVAIGALAVAALLLAAAVPRAVVPGQGAAWAASTLVLEAPAGAPVACRLEVLALAAPRAVEPCVLLEGDALPLPALRSAASAQEQATLRLVPLSVQAPLGPVPRAFLRSDATALPAPGGGPGGAVRLTRGAGGQAITIENGTDLALDRVLAITPQGVHALDDLAPGATAKHDLDLLVPPQPFARWRLAPDLGPADRAWRALVTAAMAGRDLGGQLVLVGRAAAVRRVKGGVQGEHFARPLIVITASEETSPR